jgi:NADH-quinone oxidoreductase subunit J
LPEPTLSAVAENPIVLDSGVPFTTSAKSFGYSLFTKYMLPFQVTGFLLLAAMIGVIVVSKKHEAVEESDHS